MRHDIPLADRCHGRWHGILTALGVDAKLLNKKHQPCPMCGGKDRFRWTNHEEKGGYYCNGCGSGSGIDLVGALFSLDFKGTARKIETIIGTVDLDLTRTRNRGDTIAAMRALWSQGHKIRSDDPVGLYLAHRGIVRAEYPACLRYVPNLRHDDGQAPGMIAKVVSPDGKAANVHRTWLTPEGRKADIAVNRKLMPGTLPDGSAIRLAPVEDEMGIAEGIETSFAAMQLFSVPVWSLISEAGIRKFRPPPSVKRLHIFGDNDLSYVGQAAALIAARDIARDAKRDGRDLEISIHIPEASGTDWADAVSVKECAAA